jgi:hypothetical protein
MWNRTEWFGRNKLIAIKKKNKRVERKEKESCSSSFSLCFLLMIEAHGGLFIFS